MARPVAYAGTCRHLVYARAHDGSYPAKEFFDHLPHGVKNRFAVSFKRLGDTGKVRNKEQFDAIEGTDFYEFKSDGYRLICRFLEGGRVLLTNGCEEKRHKLAPQKVKCAERIYEEDKFASESNGSPATQ